MTAEQAHPAPDAAAALDTAAKELLAVVAEARRPDANELHVVTCSYCGAVRPVKSLPGIRVRGTDLR